MQGAHIVSPAENFPFPLPSPLIQSSRAQGVHNTKEVTRIAGPAQRVAVDEDCLLESHAPADCHVLLDGMLYRYKMLQDGKRQIIAFLLPGENFGLAGFLLGHSDHSVAALVPSHIATIPASRLLGLSGTAPGAMNSLWQDMLVQDSIAREWIANIGRRRASERIAHLICEMRARLHAAPAGGKVRFRWQVSQAILGDATSLSIVHVNRVLQQLRADRLVTFQDGMVEIEDLEQLEEFAGFDDAYLHLGRTTASRPFALTA